MPLCLLGAGQKEVWLEGVTQLSGYVPFKDTVSGEGASKKHQRTPKRARQGQGGAAVPSRPAAAIGGAVVELSSDNDLE